MSLSPHSQVIVRDARPEDALQIAELGALIFSTSFGHSVDPDDLRTYLKESYSVEATTADLTSPSKDMIVATNGENGEIIGFALLRRGTNDPCIEHLESKIELQRLYVHPDFHGKGVGKSLEAQAEDLARKQMFEYIWLGVWEENHNAIMVYNKIGYKKVGSHDFTTGRTVQKDDVMVKRL
jgi:ribosomal protein S18 acetylase RimI-like enzyme